MAEKLPRNSNMAPVQWSELPPGVVDVIAKRLDSDIDLLRIRSVCSSWRSSVIPRPRDPYSLPLKMPQIRNELHCFDGKKGYYTLHENTVYRFTPPADGNRADDSCADWMVKVSETDSNELSLLKPFSTEKLRYPAGTIPKYLNLLDYRVSEVGKSYTIKGRNYQGSSTRLVVLGVIKKVLPLWNYVMDCGFAALALEYFGEMSFWKVGDEGWADLDTKGHKIQDMMLYDGICYAVDIAGVLVSFDSKMQLAVVAIAADNFAAEAENILLEYESDMYVVSKDYHDGPGFFEFYEFAIQPETLVNVALTVCKFDKCNGKWDCIRDLGDNVFILGKDVAVGVSAKDFEVLKGNSVYLTDWGFIDEVYGDVAGIYHLDNPTPLRIATTRHDRLLSWRPPSWIMPSASSSEP